MLLGIYVPRKDRIRADLITFCLTISLLRQIIGGMIGRFHGVKTARRTSTLKAAHFVGPKKTAAKRSFSNYAEKKTIYFRCTANNKAAIVNSNVIPDILYSACEEAGISIPSFQYYMNPSIGTVRYKLQTWSQRPTYQSLYYLTMKGLAGMAEKQTRFPDIWGIHAVYGYPF